MSIQKENYTLVKKDISRSRHNPQVAKRITFAHEVSSVSGTSTYTINLQSLNTPSSLLVNGFVQATMSEINGALIGIVKKNLRLISSIKGNLIQNKDFIVVDNYTVNIINDCAFALEVGEIIVGEIDSQIGDLIPASTKNKVKAFTHPAGQKLVNLGHEFVVGEYSTEKVGAVKLSIRGGGPLFRNSGNSQTVLDGDYYEVDSGNGSGTTIMLNSAPALPLDLLADFGPYTITNSDSIGAIQSIMGAVKKIANDLATVVGGSSTDYLTANPSEIERRTFGDYVLSLISRYNVDSKLSDYTKTKWQKKTIGSIASSGTIASGGFNNLSIGKSYRYTLLINNIINNSGDDRGLVSQVVHNSVVLARFDSIFATSSTEVVYGDNTKQISVVFIAEASSISWVIQDLNINSLSGGFAILEELPNHEVTTQWT